MSQRKSILASEEGSLTPGSPLRRSTRIANSPAPAPAQTITTAPISRRRSSAADSTTSTPSKLGPRKRPSLSHEVLLEEKPETPKRATKGARAASAEPEVKVVGTPAKRGRRSSVSKIIEEETKEVAKAESPTTRRRSIRGQSTSPTRESSVEPAAPKPRGRRASVTLVAPLEAIAETVPPKVTRPVRATRRASVDASEDVEVKKEEKKPATRRSIRGRSNSVDIPEEEESKPIQELIPINEEEVEIVEEHITETKPEEVITVSEETIGDTEQPKQLIEDAEVELALAVKEQTQSPQTSPRKSRERISLSEEVFKSPVRRSPRLSGSPAHSNSPSHNEIEALRPSSRLSEVFDDMENKADETTSENEESNKQNEIVSPLPRKSLRKSSCSMVTEDSNVTTANVTEDVSHISRVSPSLNIATEETSLEKPADSRRSLRKSVSPMVTEERNSSPAKRFEDQIELSNNYSRPLRKSVSPCPKEENNSTENSMDARRSLRKSESPMKTEEASKVATPTKFHEPLSNIPTSPKRRSLRLSESQATPKETMMLRRKSSSLSENDTKDVDNPRLSRSFGENKHLNNSLNTSKVKKDTSLRNEADMTFGSDGSFHLNISIPPSTDSEPNEKSANKSIGNAVLDCSGSSNNSDKENADKLNLVQSPANKRLNLSVNDTSTPKMNNSIKMHSFCEPMEVDFVVVGTPEINLTNTSLFEKSHNDSNIIEVDNADEFGTSPVKRIKEMNNKSIQNEEELENELMQSFVDEVIEESGSETSDDKKPEEVAMVQTQDSKRNENDKTEEKPTEKVCEIQEAKKVSSPGIEVQAKSKIKEIIVSEFVEPESNNYNRSKKRRIHSAESLDNMCEKSNFKTMIEQKLQDIDTSEDDDDYQPANEFLDDMAMEGEEDTPSEGSNDIIDEGESLHSSESEVISDVDDEYENDSFIADDESIELLSGHEYDLDIDDKQDGRDKKKKRKSRIITVSDSSDDDVVEVVKPETQNENVAKEQEDVENVPKKVIILQNIKIANNVPDSVVINEEDNLKSLETIKQTTNIEVLKEPKPSLSTPNNSITESPTPRKSRRKTSINIQEQIKLSQLNDGAINEKFSKAVDFFVSSINEKSGNVSVNVSLDYANTSMSSEEEPGSTVDTQRVSKNVSLRKEDVENLNDVVDEILEQTLNERSLRKKGHVSIEDSFDVEDESEQNETKTKQRNRRSSSGAGRQNISIQEEFEVFEEDDSKKEKRKGNRRQSRGKIEECLEDSVVFIEDEPEASTSTKKPKKRTSHIDEPIVIELSPMKSPMKKLKLNKCISEDVSVQKQIRLSLIKSLDSSLQADKGKKRVSLDKSTSFRVEIEPDSTKEAQKKKKKSINTALDASEFNEFEDKLSKKKRKRSLVNMEQNVSKAGNKLKYFPNDMLVEMESNAQVTRTEIPTTINQVPSQKKMKKSKPSTTNIDSGNGWEVLETEGDNKPSRKNKDKVLTVGAQIEKLKQTFAPNDFKNQMIYDSKQKRMDSKLIVRNKQKAGFSQKSKK